MTVTPRFSVVLPVYNRSHELAGAVSSVLRQSDGDLELIVVDDASPDPAAVADAVAVFADQRVRLVVRERNGGVAAAQNSGLATARGEFIAFLHSDDRFAPAKLAVQGATLAAAPASVLAVESAYLVAGRGAAMAPGLTGVGFEELLGFRCGVHVVPMLFRREAVARLGFDEGLRAWEDWDLLVRLLRNGEVLTTDDVVGELRKDGDGRLSDSPWMAHGLEHLLGRYDAELATRPALRAVWHLKIARAQIRNGATAQARIHLVAAVRADPHRWQLLAPAAATVLGRRAGQEGWRIYERLGRRRA
ncbi:MAG: glycosyltransferase family 2 protein [Acidimicrobiales bacterium]